MDKEFFDYYLINIARFNSALILNDRDKDYFIKYINKLGGEIKYLNKCSFNSYLNFVNDFEKQQSRYVSNGIFHKPKNMLHLACETARDVLQAMERFEGVGAEKWVTKFDNPKVNFED